MCLSMCVCMRMHVCVCVCVCASTQAVMDPEAGCPYVVHLLSLNGQRPGNQVHFMNNITHYNSKTPVRWWKVQQQQQKQQTWP